MVCDIKKKIVYTEPVEQAGVAAEGRDCLERSHQKTEVIGKAVGHT